MHCTYCGAKGHDIITCRNIKEVKRVVALVIEQPLQQHSQPQKIPYRIPSKPPFTRPNKGPPYEPGDGQLRWNDEYNKYPVWNGPPTNPNTHQYGLVEKGKIIICYRCSELGHYARDCPNTRKPEGYIPFGHCDQPGHVSTICTTIIIQFSPSNRDYLPRKQIQIQEIHESSNTHNVNYLAVSEPSSVFITRSQGKQTIVESDQVSSSDSDFHVLRVKDKTLELKQNNLFL